jgi:hypothetical protein
MKQDIIAAWRYPAPVPEEDWTLTALGVVQVTLVLALERHVPGWSGATDKQLKMVAAEIIVALDKPAVRK